ncbi:DUF1493 family protein [Flavobacterium sp. WV_118_3]|uniref:DUF1493 family protein n=1 Tax=Flavobacterium sp. WV_118_3 TaxID=3151764 RepID=UPI003219F873
MESLENRVINFFNKWVLKDDKISLDTIINTINLDREDAISIFEEFLTEFDIKSGYATFEIDRYFYKLTFWDALFINMFTKRIEKKYAKKTPITIAHMIEVTKRKAWFDPIEKY